MSRAAYGRRRVQIEGGIGSLGTRPDTELKRAEEVHNEFLTPLSDLDLMIRNGWGNTRQDRMPKDWRTRRNPRRRTTI